VSFFGGGGVVVWWWWLDLERCVVRVRSRLF
jgi:hypothetical protein